jgi:hypothetical protein
MTHGFPNKQCVDDVLLTSQREPTERKVRKGRAAKKEYRAWPDSKNPLRNSTNPCSVRS